MTLTFHPLTEQVNIGGHTFTVAALPLGVIRREVAPMAARFTVDAALDPDVFDNMLRFTHMSVSKADPSITPDNLENSLSLGDFMELFQAVMRVSGMSSGEIKQGEALRQPTSSEAGESSTDTSQPAQDGHIAILTPS